MGTGASITAPLILFANRPGSHKDKIAQITDTPGSDISPMRYPDSKGRSTKHTVPDHIDESTRRRDHPSIRRFAWAAAGILLPLAILPYAVSRHRHRALETRLRAAERAFGDVRVDVRAAALELDRTRTELVRLVERVEEVGKEVEGMRERERGVAEVQFERERLNTLGGRKAVERLRLEQARSFKDVAEGMGVLAGFVHEMDLRLGVQGEHRRVDQLRKLALRLESPPLPPLPTSTDPKSDTQLESI